METEIFDESGVNFMPLSPTQDVLLARPVRYILPDDLMFEGLAHPQGTETARIRFSRGRGTTLDIPLSAESLAVLVQVMSSLHGVPTNKLADELEYLRRNHGFLE
jgi:hypothetical protein